MAFSTRELDTQFSTYAAWSSHEDFSWIEWPLLKRSMDGRRNQLSSEQGGVDNADFWVAYWHQRWKVEPRPFAQDHLYAYLQESCYWNALDLSRRFNAVNFGVADCFQTAMCKTEQILQNFNPDLGVSLSTYAGRSFGNAMRDALGRHDSVHLCSDLSLLRRSSLKLLKESLESASLVLVTHEAAWRCFRAIFSPPSGSKMRDLGHLTHDDWAAMVREYNKLRATRSDLPVGGQADLRDWLHGCVVSLRRYKAPASVSLNNTCRENDQEFVDQLADEQADAMARRLAEESEQARLQLRQQVAEVLSTSLETLCEADKHLLDLFYAEGLKQAEIAERVKSDQPKVSRRLKKIRQTLLKDLMLWAKRESHNSQNSQVLKHMSRLVDDWLTLQFSGERKEHVAA